MNTEELNKIIENHKHWLAEDCEGWENMRANLSGADLRRADLRRADLRRADLRRADLSGAYLSGADLSGAYLSGAYLSGAYLSGANLSGANLRRAYLRRANLSDANLRRAYLSGADLRRANLSDANLSGADLRRADLSDADLSGVRCNENTAFLALACPEEGAFIGWKKANGYIIKLRIPKDAKRSSATSRKCRCSHAEVLEIQNRDGSKADIDSVVNEHYAKTTYTVGETVHADSWDEDRWSECSHGIHFFITRDEAVNY